MSEVPSWAPVHALVTIGVYLAHFFINDATLVSPGGTVLDSIASFLSFITLQDLPAPDWFNVLLFAAIALPWLMWIASLVFGTTVGTIAGIIGGLVAGIGAFFTGLFD